MKAYVKPELIYEHYELSQNVADCTWNMNNTDTSVCKGDGSDKGFDDILFTDTNGCTVMEGDIAGYCYTASQGGVNIFLS